MEGHLINADGGFRKINEDLQLMLVKIDDKFKESEGRSNEFAYILQEMADQNKQRKEESQELLNRALKMGEFMEEQRKMFATAQKDLMDELLKNVGGRSVSNVSTELGKELKSEPPLEQPPGLSMGSDDRGLGVRVDQKDPPFKNQNDKARAKDTDSHATEKYLEERNDITYFPERYKN